MTPEELAIHQLLIQKAAQEAERKAVEEYRIAEDPQRLLRRRIYSIIASTASAAIDAQPVHPIVSRPMTWHQNMGRTAERIQTDPLFHRLVSAQAAEIICEVERYEAAKQETPCAKEP